MLVVFALAVARAVRDLRREGRVSAGHLMALLLVLSAGTMLARMPLLARINHFGFFQAALAGMVAAAAVVSEVPARAGKGAPGRWFAQAVTLLLLAAGCLAVARRSAEIRADQTQPVGTGRDRFYAFDREVDETGLQVNWCVEHLQSIPPEATLQVLPEGSIINYLTRHVRPLWDFHPKEEDYIRALGRARPDYVVLITRDMREYGLKNFGAPGSPGEMTVAWLRENYEAVDSLRGTVRGAVILRRKPAR
jgi:hypothetical protein